VPRSIEPGTTLAGHLEQMKPQTLKIVTAIARKSKKYRDFRDSIAEIARGFSGRSRYDFTKEAFEIFERALRNRRLAKRQLQTKELSTFDLCRKIDAARLRQKATGIDENGIFRA